MPEPSRFVCNRVDPGSEPWIDAVPLAFDGPDSTINFDHGSFLRRLGAPVPDRLIDLIEIAAFIYAGDSHVGRGPITEPRQGAAWRRRLEFRIGVRDLAFWRQAVVRDAIADLLGFLSEDDYHFEFVHAPGLAPHQGQFDLQPDAGNDLDRIVMFSGGLDSLSGAVDLLGTDMRLGLVSLETSRQAGKAQRVLAGELENRFGEKCVQLFQIALNLREDFAKERTHRSRAFLFAAVGAVVGHVLGQSRLDFFENGVLSLNLPIAKAVVGARATRTTHPRTLKGFSSFFEAVFETPFHVQNPWFELTKTDVTRRLEQRGHADLIGVSRSCANMRAGTRAKPHCGHCSQCIDRRFAVLAAELSHHDPEEAYAIDLLLGPRDPGPKLVLALQYHNAARRMCQLSPEALFAEFPEAAQALNHLDRPPAEAARLMHTLHQRHGDQVTGVTRNAAKTHADDLAKGRLSPDCLLVKIVGGGLNEAHQPVHELPAPPDNLPVLVLAFGKVAKQPVVRIRGIGDIAGVGAKTIFELRQAHEAGVRNGLVPENFPLLGATELVDALSLSGEDLLRKRIMRIRRDFNAKVQAAGYPEPDLNALVESIPGKGYRINPTQVRVVEWSELSGSGTDT